MGKVAQFVCANGRKLKVAQCVREATVQLGKRVFTTELLIAETSQEVLLGYDFLRKAVSVWNSGKGTSVLRRPEATSVEERKREEARVEGPAQPQLKEEETKKVTRTQKSGKTKPEEELQERRAKDRIPFKRASREEEAQKESGEGEMEEKDEVRLSKTEQKRNRGSFGENRLFKLERSFQLVEVEDWEKKPGEVAAVRQAAEAMGTRTGASGIVGGAREKKQEYARKHNRGSGTARERYNSWER